MLKENDTDSSKILANVEGLIVPRARYPRKKMNLLLIERVFGQEPPNERSGAPWKQESENFSGKEIRTETICILVGFPTIIGFQFCVPLLLPRLQ